MGKIFNKTPRLHVDSSRMLTAKVELGIYGCCEVFGSAVAPAVMGFCVKVGVLT